MTTVFNSNNVHLHKRFQPHQKNYQLIHPQRFRKVNRIVRSQRYHTVKAQNQEQQDFSDDGRSRKMFTVGFAPTSPQGWMQMINLLKESGIRCLSPQELSFEQDKGTTAIDIRPAAAFEKFHIENTVNVPLFQPIEGWTPWKIARRAGFALFGVLNGTEINPNFVQEIDELVQKDNGVVILCDYGGDLGEEKSDTSSLPRQSRSLMAAYQLCKLGYKNVSVVKGGVNGWIKSGRDYAVGGTEE
eukprot:TRINITY_DN61173_c0_g1_i1.p1 TRINITY_DN61173_c0_g1~~TRINITY_DN61173_c0_g1_i1.p1  ORF type:complete len:253 (-),score=34.46 TRINITY_DN61173_c0_g1_i1:216-944(-)